MKRATLTGVSGFVGHHVLEYLLANTDWEFVCLVKMSRAGDLNRLKYVLSLDPSYEKRVLEVWHDLRDPLDSIHKHIGKVDYVVHMAADSHVDDSLVRRVDVFMNNTMSTVNVFEYCMKYQKEVEKIIYYSTDEVFGDAPDDYKFKEDDALNPRSPYSAGKASGEMIASAYRQAFKLPILSMRTMNMFGERQDPEKMIPKTIGRYLQGLPAIVHATGDRIGARYWLHAQNSADAIKFCLENEVPFDKINVPGQVELDNLKISEMIANIMDIPFKYELVEAESVRPGYDRRYSVDGSRIMELGWRPPLDFTEALIKTVKWTMKNPQWVKTS